MKEKMANRPRLIPAVIAAALLALCLPLVASAQGGYDPWGRNRDRDYRRNRDYDDDDYYYGRGSRNSLRESVRRLKDAAHQLQRDLDHELDHSRENGTRHEDRLNEVAKDFRDAASDLKDSFGNGRNMNNSAHEARRVINLGNQLGRRIQHHFDDYRIRSDWQRVSQELRVIQNAYGYGYDGYYGRDDDYYGRDRNDDRWRRRRNTNNDWSRRLPFPMGN